MCLFSLLSLPLLLKFSFHPRSHTTKTPPLGSVGWPQWLASPCACFWAQLPAALIFADHYLGRITALVTILAICSLNLALWIAALVNYFVNSAPSPSHPS